jgi:hypothetical protein
MKKIASFLIVALVALQGAAFAGTVEGTVKAVDTAMKKLEVSSVTGSSSVSYDAATIWPAGVVDPISLVGKDVTVTTNDMTATAVSVEEKAAVAAPVVTEAAPEAPVASN